MPRKRPRKTELSQIKTVLQAWKREVSDDIETFDSMVQSLAPGEGVGVKDGKLAKIHFQPTWRPPRVGEKVNW